MKNQHQRDAAEDALHQGTGFRSLQTLFGRLLSRAGPGWLVEFQEAVSGKKQLLKLEDIPIKYQPAMGIYVQLVAPLEIHNPHSEFKANERVSCSKEAAGEVWRYWVRVDPDGDHYIVPAYSTCDCDGCRGLSRDPQWRFTYIQLGKDD